MPECGICGKELRAGYDGVVPNPSDPNGPWVHEACAAPKLEPAPVTEEASPAA